jgi:hypothetical protein
LNQAELELAKDSTAMAEEEVFQVAKELKEVRVALASAKYETSVTRKMQVWWSQLCISPPI